MKGCGGGPNNGRAAKLYGKRGAITDELDLWQIRTSAEMVVQNCSRFCNSTDNSEIEELEKTKIDIVELLV
jgi:hypothetical protein